MSERDQPGEKTLAAVLSSNGDGLVSPFHQGDFMAMSKPGLQTVNNLDAINEMEVPSSWARFDQSSVRSRSVVFRPDTNSSAEIAFLERNRPVDGKAAEAFDKIVGSPDSTPRLLYSDKVGANPQNLELFKTLAGALGSSLVGDNQLTCAQVGPDCRQPAFHMDSARVETINGRNVIAVDGWFGQMDDKAQTKNDATGSAKRYYTGIFFEAGAKGSKVDEMYLTADDQASFLNNKTAYRSATETIKWR